MKCGDCINYGTCRHTCNVVRISDICSSFLGKLSCDGCKYDSDRFSDICYHDCIMFSDYQKEDISIPKEKPMNKVIFEIKSKTHGIKEVIIDADDVDKFNEYKWHLSYDKCTDGFYVITDIIIEGEKKTMKLHRYLTDCPSDKIVDHINHNGLDNRKSNLRICTYGENNQNSRSKKDNTSSLYKGVYWKKKDNKYVAQIGFEGKKIHLGYFDNDVDGAIAYNKKAEELFGEFACLNIIPKVNNCVEEAEEMYKNFLHEYENPGVDTSWSNTVACIKKQHEALQALKTQLKELGGER